MPACHAPRYRYGAAARAVTVAVAAALAATAASGCGAFDRALGQRWVTVTFRQGTAVPAMLATMTACSHLRNVVPEPLAAARRQASRSGTIVYRIDRATDAQVALLQLCLQRQHPFASMTINDVGNQ